MAVLRKKIADGTVTPSDIRTYEETATRQKAVDSAIEIATKAIVEARHDKLHIGGMWAGLYAMACATDSGQDRRQPVCRLPTRSMKVARPSLICP